MSFRDTLILRSAALYAGFLVPHLRDNARMLDCGCGSGSITVGLAATARQVIGLDRSAATFATAVTHVESERIQNVRFVVADGGLLPFAAESFDAVLMHSVLEAATDPPSLVREALRVLVPGGVLAAASVEYGGRVLAGPHRDALERFYEVREKLWALESVARPRGGRQLRQLLHRGGFTEIDAAAHYMSYGNADAVREFGKARAGDCDDPWFSQRSEAHQLLTADELAKTRRAWEEWSKSPEAFFAFAWCRVVGKKPSAWSPRPCN